MKMANIRPRTQSSSTNLRSLAFLLWLAHLFAPLHAQEYQKTIDVVLGSPALTQPVFTSLDEALLRPLEVYHLDLSGQTLRFLPNEINQLKNLEKLELRHNSLRDIPEEITQLKQLSLVDLGNNPLLNAQTVLPLLIQLPALQDLILDSCTLEKLPLLTSKPPKLKHLNLSHNQIAHFPAYLWTWPELRKLNLAYNQLQQLPMPGRASSHLTHLYLQANQIYTLPQALDQFKYLKELNLTYNLIEQCSFTLLEIPTLETIALYQNPLSERFVEQLETHPLRAKVLY